MPNKELYEAKNTNHGGILNHEPLMEVEFLERWMR